MRVGEWHRWEDVKRKRNEIDERRERYAAALAAVPEDMNDAYGLADAAMGVADDELQSERERLHIPLHRAEAQNARLRADLGREHERAEFHARNYEKFSRLAFERDKENNLLRTE